MPFACANILPSLGCRQVVRQRTLNPPSQVQILAPQLERPYLHMASFYFLSVSLWICKMDTRICNHCGETKPVDEFNWRWKSRGERQRTCRSCQNKQKSNWYLKNKETHKSNVYKNKLKKIEAAREYIWNYLSTHPCQECGENDPSVLEFDHVKGKKKAEVTKLMRDGYSIGAIQQEIAKCVVLCANCHKKKTYKDSWRDRG